MTPDAAGLLDARAQAYDLLKCAFLQEPSLAFVEVLIDSGAVAAFPFADGDGPVARAIARVQRDLDRADARGDARGDALRWDYTRMFVGPGLVPAPPWESIYRDREGLHCSAHTLAVRDLYRRHNLAAAGLGREPDDHVGFELAFLQILCERGRDAAERGDRGALAANLEDQLAFLDDHLLRWVPAWAADAARAAETEFFRGLAELAAAFLVLDRGLAASLLAGDTLRGQIGT